MDNPAIELNGIEFRSSEKTILTIPRLEAEKGSHLAITGPNGAGKSTLLQIVALLINPSSGEILIDGTRANRHNSGELRRQMAYVFQAPLLFNTSVLANAASGLRFRGLRGKEADRRAMEWLDRFGVAQLASRSPRHLSGGEARRVSLARAFALEPSILLLDEPFAGLDAETRTTLLPELHQHICDSRATTLLVTHDPREAELMSNRTIHLRDGRIESSTA